MSIGTPFKLDSADLKKNFWSGYTDTPAFWKNVAPQVIPSSNGTETYRWLDTLSSFEDWTFKGEIPDAELNKHEDTWANKDLGRNMLIFDKELRRDQTGMIRLRAQGLGAGYPAKQNSMLATLMEGAAADKTKFDAQYFFDDDHPGLDAPGGASTTFDNSFALDLTTDNLETVVYTMQQYRLLNGELANVTPDTLVVPSQLQFTAKKIVNSLRVMEDANNAENQLGFLNVVVYPSLTDTNKWYVLDNSKPIKPFFWQEELPLRVLSQEISKTNDEYIRGRRYRLSADASGCFGHSLWFLAAMSNPS